MAQWFDLAIQAFTFGRRPRTLSAISANEAWNTTTSASALSNR